MPRRAIWLLLTTLTLVLLSAAADEDDPLSDARLLFTPFVFASDAFPDCEFENPDAVRKLIGAYELKPHFYDADFKPVRLAVKPGRYGAIVEIHSASGLVAKRYVTLYKVPREVDWHGIESKLAGAGRLEGIGLDPAVLREQPASFAPFFGQYYFEHKIGRLAADAVLLAALSETKPGSRRGSDPGQWWIHVVDNAWWDHLRAQTGDLYEPGYISWLPAGYEKDETKRWPLIVFLHGSGERGRNAEALRDTAFAKRLLNDPQPAIVVAPQCPPDEWWLTSALERFTDQMLKKYRVDPDRIYVTGMSMGGIAIWSWASANPGRFAALAPVCGAGDPDGAGRLSATQIWAFHGVKDPSVPVTESECMAAAVRAAGGQAKLTLYPDAGHDCWNQAYAEPDLFRWMLGQRRGR